MRAISCMTCAIVLCVASSLSGTASADSVDKPAVNDKPVVKKAPKPSASKAKPDKNHYWLLNPTPPDQMRSFSTDRPTKSNVPYTVDAGHFQYETDLVNFTHQVTGSTHTDTLLAPNPTFKVGLTNNADLEVNVPFAGVHTSRYFDRTVEHAMGHRRHIRALKDQPVGKRWRRYCGGGHTVC